MTFKRVDFYDRACIYQSDGVSYGFYTENGLHKPPVPVTLNETTLLYYYENVMVPSRDKYRRMVLPITYDPSGSVPTFMKVTETFGLSSRYVYGWVDSIRPVVQQTHVTGNTDSNVPTYEINWHVDWWLTAGNMAAYKAGRLKRGPSQYARPDPSTPRYWNYTSKVKITDVANVASPPWCIVQYVKNTYDPNDPDKIVTTEIATRFWNFYAQAMDLSQNVYDPISIQELYSGLLEDEMGLDPDTIIGAWICPVQPFEMANLVFNGTKYWWEADGLTPRVTTFTSSSFAGKTTDTVKYLVTDPYGAVVGTVPWGLAFSVVRVNVDVGAAGANLMMSFLTTSSSLQTGEGRTMTVPLISVPVTSNARASYAYSGQRAYDIESKRIQNEQSLVSGIAGAGTSAIGGAIAGGTVGPAGMAAGAVGGLLSSVLGSTVNFAATGIYDKQSQAATDRLMSNQANNVIVNTGGLGWYAAESQWYLVKMTRDSVSLAELNAEQSELGYITDTQVADCTSLISNKGPLRIEGLEVYRVTGEAAAVISAMFARGVHID